MTQDAQLWNDLLFQSGGMLELPKCSFHLLHFNFRSEGSPKPMAYSPDKYPIQVIDSMTGKTISIKPMQISVAHQTLGHYKAPAESASLLTAFIRSNAVASGLAVSYLPVFRIAGRTLLANSPEKSAESAILSQYSLIFCVIRATSSLLVPSLSLSLVPPSSSSTIRSYTAMKYPPNNAPVEEGAYNALKEMNAKDAAAA